MKTIDQMTKAELKEHIKVQTRFSDKLEADYKDAIKKQELQIEKLRDSYDKLRGEHMQLEKFSDDIYTKYYRTESSIDSILEAHTTLLTYISKSKKRKPF